MKKVKDNKLENEKGADELERFIQMKKDENLILQKLLKALKSEEQKHDTK